MPSVLDMPMVSNTELLIEEIKTLSSNSVDEVLDFVGYLKSKRDLAASERCFNASTEAAVNEGMAMLRGDVPAKWYNSVDEMLTDLDSDD